MHGLENYTGGTFGLLGCGNTKRVGKQVNIVTKRMRRMKGEQTGKSLYISRLMGSFSSREEAKCVYSGAG
jgi:hypothetical protein